MRYAIVSLLGLSLMAVGCGSEAGASSNQPANVAQALETTLENIKTPEDAQESKDELDRLVSDFSAAMPRMPSAGEAENAVEGMAEKGREAVGNMGSEMSEALAGIKRQVDRIAANPALAAPIQDVLDRLQGLLKG